MVVVVLAQSAEPWSVEPRFSALVGLPGGGEGEALRAFVPDYEYRLVELATLPFEGMRGTPAATLVLRVMKAERLGKLLDDVVWDEAVQHLTCGSTPLAPGLHSELAEKLLLS